MIEIDAVGAVDGERRAEIEKLVSEIEAIDGHAALNEHALLDLLHGSRSGYAGFVARDPDHGHVVGYAHLSSGSSPGDGATPHQWTLEVAVHPQHRGVGVELALAKAAVDAARRGGGGQLHFWAFRPTEIHDALAHQLGLALGRELLQMRRTLPIDAESLNGGPKWPAGVTVRNFEPGRDEDAWLTVNNRAFGGHPEQGSWDRATLERREAEAWFDPKGFLIADDDRGMAGFCWTKIHPDHVGEIYVVGVDPERQGTGLGRALVLAGLGSLADRGCTTGMLYVDASNTSAVRLYEALGFAVDHVDRAYVTDL